MTKGTFCVTPFLVDLLKKKIIQEGYDFDYVVVLIYIYMYVTLHFIFKYFLPSDSRSR